MLGPLITSLVLLGCPRVAPAADAGPECVPAACPAGGCGTLPSGCGWLVACGSCGASQSCGLGGVNACASATSPSLCSSDGWCWASPFPSGARLRSVFALGSTDAWAVGAGGVALQLSATGWANVATGLQTELLAVWGAAGQLWVAGAEGALRRRTGSAWVAVDHPLAGTATALHALWGSGPTDVWTAGEAGALLHFNGTSWSRSSSGVTVTLRAGTSTGLNEAWAVGDEGTVLRFDGTGWSKVAVPTAVATAQLRGVFARGGEAWAVADLGALHFAGGGWKVVTAPSGLRAVHGRSDGVWAVGDAGEVARWDGTGFALAASSASRALHGVWAASGLVLAVGEAGARIQLEPPGGVASGAVTRGALRAVFAGSSNDVWAAGSGAAAVGELLHFDGTRWSRIAGAGANPLRGVWSLWAVGDHGTVVELGAAPKVSSAGVDEPLAAVFGFSASDVWAVGGRAVLHFNGTRWSEAAHPATPALRAIWGAGPTDVWAMGETGAALRWNGLAWAKVASGTVVALNALHGRTATDVWAAGNDGVVLHWDGAQWTPSATAATEHLLGIHARAASDVWAAGAGGAVLRFNGAGWTTEASGAGQQLGAVSGSGATLWAVGEEGAILVRRP